MVEMDTQIKGIQHDSVQRKDLDGLSDDYFQKVKTAFFNINGWDRLFAKATNFQVTDELGNDKFDEIKTGDFVKINIPGPKNKVGAGFDWVRICYVNTTVEENCITCSIAVSPCCRPGTTDKTAHFLSPIAKNYFMIRKFPNEITAEVHGRNELPNYRHLNIRDKFRNFLVANGGIFGLSKIHWKIWAKNILDPEIVNKS